MFVPNETVLQPTHSAHAPNCQQQGGAGFVHQELVCPKCVQRLQEAELPVTEVPPMKLFTKPDTVPLHLKESCAGGHQC